MFSMLANRLTGKLIAELNWKHARLECLGILITSILRFRTVNLVKLAAEAHNHTSEASLYRRFQNFFLKFAMPLDDISELVLSKIPKPKGGWVLSMDRTNWKYGRTHINLLVIGVVSQKVAIPICWTVLPQVTKRGNSNKSQRIKLMKRLLKFMPAEDIKALTMDREFIGKQWLHWLDNNGVKYIVRIKGNMKVGGKRASEFRHGSQLNRTVKLKVSDADLFFAGCKISGKNTRDEFLYVVSNFYHGKEARSLYKKRWGIEMVFSHLKKRGFDLETTHMSDPKKIEKLFGVLTLAFLISYGWGSEMKQNNELKSYSKRKSIFRLGLDQITRMFTNPERFKDDIDRLLDWFSTRKYHSIIVV